MGWGVDKVHNYKKLNKICGKAWELITTTFDNMVVKEENEMVGDKTTTVVFSERLLREILSLLPDQQIELVQDLIDGRIQKGRFKTLAQAYNARNEMKTALTGSPETNSIHSDLYLYATIQHKAK